MKRKHSHIKIDTSKTEKIQKVLARLGLGSRREIETWVEAGRIFVNGKKATIGDRINVIDRVKVDGKLIHMSRTPQRTRILVFNKPTGLVCTRSDPEGRPTVFSANSRLKSKRWIMVGRLDFNTAGLLVFTNDGDLANKLMHPSSEIEREYAVRVIGEVDNKILKELQKGVHLEDGVARFNAIKDAGGQGKNHWYHVLLKEGRYREVRRLWEYFDITVSRLIRLRFGNIHLPRSLRQGQLVELSSEEVNAVKALIH